MLSEKQSVPLSKLSEYNGKSEQGYLSILSHAAYVESGTGSNHCELPLNRVYRESCACRSNVFST